MTNDILQKFYSVFSSGHQQENIPSRVPSGSNTITKQTKKKMKGDYFLRELKGNEVTWLQFGWSMGQLVLLVVSFKPLASRREACYQV